MRTTNPIYTGLPTTIFEVMSRLAIEHGAINLGQGFPDVDGPEDVRRWQRILHARGWGATSWPVEFGGTGWTRVEQYLFELECAVAGAPAQLPFGVKMVAPVLMRFGSPAQQQYFLPRIRSGEDWWCQGYSEPGAGSDLASLKTQATARRT